VKWYVICAPPEGLDGARLVGDAAFATWEETELMEVPPPDARAIDLALCL
jgi:hypothetical protein